MTTKISDFFPGTTKTFSLTVTLNGTVADLRLDTLTVFLKTSVATEDDDAPIAENADVATAGVNGIATWTLTPVITDIAPGRYICEIKWVRSTGEEYIVYHETIKILERISET